MTTNTPPREELRGILTDVANHRFSFARQINPQSNLYLTAKGAADRELVAGANFEERSGALLALMDLTQAHLTPTGQATLTQLNQEN